MALNKSTDFDRVSALDDLEADKMASRSLAGSRREMSCFVEFSRSAVTNR